jgi:biopolymer transport protein ExbB
MARIVTVALLVMALATLTVFIDRWVLLLRASLRARRFAGASQELGDTAALRQLTVQTARDPLNPLSRLVLAGSRRYLEALEGREADSDVAVQAARREMSRAGEAVSAELRTGMSVLASVGSVAPFVGLFGTVLGIISTFQSIQASGSGGLGAVSAGIAEALVVTALGLCVAIPAVLLFNYLSARIERLELRLTHSAGEFLEELERIHAHRIRQSHDRYNLNHAAAE